MIIFRFIFNVCLFVVNWTKPSHLQRFRIIVMMSVNVFPPTTFFTRRPFYFSGHNSSLNRTVGLNFFRVIFTVFSIFFCFITGLACSFVSLIFLITNSLERQNTFLAPRTKSILLSTKWPKFTSAFKFFTLNTPYHFFFSYYGPGVRRILSFLTRLPFYKLLPWYNRCGKEREFLYCVVLVFLLISMVLCYPQVYRFFIFRTMLI